MAAVRKSKRRARLLKKRKQTIRKRRMQLLKRRKQAMRRKKMQLARRRKLAMRKKKALKKHLPKSRKVMAKRATPARKMKSQPKKASKPASKQALKQAPRKGMKRTGDEFVSKVLRQLHRDKIPISTKAKGKMISFIRKFANNVATKAKSCKKVQLTNTIGTKDLQKVLKRMMHNDQGAELVQTTQKGSHRH
ncbi:H2B.U histone 2-like [Anolis sagrei]|uniref:H2B.U histone 2-like n=1 Tax=Anolis sagrei TaxID=38937 RepID=UPI003521B322